MLLVGAAGMAESTARVSLLRSLSAIFPSRSAISACFSPSDIAAGGGGFNFFANTPGMVTISEELYEKMAAVYYAQ